MSHKYFIEQMNLEDIARGNSITDETLLFEEQESHESRMI